MNPGGSRRARAIADAWAASLRSPSRLVGWMVAAAAALAFAMAIIQAINYRAEFWRGPPDEYAHRAAARYYLDHWLPPRVGDPATLDSYSRDYGYSYLNDLDPVYLFAGKFAKLVSPVIANADLAFRLFNATLLAILAWACLRRPTAWLVFAPLLLTPQVWYIFSYFNSDGLPLFLTMLIAYQLAVPESAFNRFLDHPGWRRGLGGALLFAVLMGILAISKKNYLAFVAFLPAALALGRLGSSAALLLTAAAIGAAGAWLEWLPMPVNDVYMATAAALLVLLGIFAPRESRLSRARVVAKLAALALVAVGLVFIRYTWDATINESIAHKMQAEGVLQERIAKPEYKPSQIFQSKNQANTFYGLNLRARGTPLKELFGPFWSWHTRTFSTFTGSYGWLQFNSPKPYAVLLIMAYVALAALYCWAAVRSRNANIATSFVVVALFSALMVAVAVHQSWVNDFQAQGRYLFPILGMLGVGWMHARRTLPARAMAATLAACFLLSLYSFVFIGFVEVQKAF